MAKASAGIPQVKTSNGRLQIVLTHQGKRKYLTLGLSVSNQNRNYADMVVRRIQNDILAGHFDPTKEDFDPETVSALVADTLPEGISIELELKHYGLYDPKAKSYVLVSPDGQTSVKGLFRKRNRYRLENEFPTQFIKLYFTEGLAAAQAYYQETRC
jgi:hypothetical protein